MNGRVVSMVKHVPILSQTVYVPVITIFVGDKEPVTESLPFCLTLAEADWKRGVFAGIAEQAISQLK
jgi:hypothetical protein